MPEDETPECMNAHDGRCEGPVEYHLRPSDWKSFPRCDFHQAQREESRQNSMERYATSDVVPDWFDPADAGERWEED